MKSVPSVFPMSSCGIGYSVLYWRRHCRWLNESTSRKFARLYTPERPHCHLFYDEYQWLLTLYVDGGSMIFKHDVQVPRWPAICINVVSKESCLFHSRSHEKRWWKVSPLFVLVIRADRLENCVCALHSCGNLRPRGSKLQCCISIFKYHLVSASRQEQDVLKFSQERSWNSVAEFWLQVLRL